MIYPLCKLVQIRVRVFEKEHFMQRLSIWVPTNRIFPKFQVFLLMMGQKTLRCTTNMHHNKYLHSYKHIGQKNL